MGAATGLGRAAAQQVEERGWAYRQMQPEETVLYEAVRDNLATLLKETCMTWKLRITRAQIEKATSQISLLSRSYDTPMARFQTDRDGWIIEVEHLEQNGAGRLKDLEAAAKQVGDELELTVSNRTGSKTRKQYHLAEISNGTYAVQVQLRDRDAKNYFRR